MQQKSDWEIPREAQPQQKDWPFDLDRALSAVVSLTSRVPEDAFTASILGTERSGSGVGRRNSKVALPCGEIGPGTV